MKVLNGLMRFLVPTFMTHYATTWGYTVYFPSKQYVAEDPDRAMRLLAHEAVHLLDSRRWTIPLFVFSYLFPQVLVLGVLGVPWLGPWAWAFLGFALPWPAPGRFYWEARAYALSMWLRYESVQTLPYRAYFTSWVYYRMFPFPKKIDHALAHWGRTIQTAKDPILHQVWTHYQAAVHTTKL